MGGPANNQQKGKTHSSIIDNGMWAYRAKHSHCSVSSSDMRRNDRNRASMSMTNSRKWAKRLRAWSLRDCNKDRSNLMNQAETFQVKSDTLKSRIPAIKEIPARPQTWEWTFWLLCCSWQLLFIFLMPWLFQSTMMALATGLLAQSHLCYMESWPTEALTLQAHLFTEFLRIWKRPSIKTQEWTILIRATHQRSLFRVDKGETWAFWAFQ